MTVVVVVVVVVVVIIKITTIIIILIHKVVCVSGRELTRMYTGTTFAGVNNTNSKPIEFNK